MILSRRWCMTLFPVRQCFLYSIPKKLQITNKIVSCGTELPLRKQVTDSLFSKNDPTNSSLGNLGNKSSSISRLNITGYVSRSWIFIIVISWLQCLSTKEMCYPDWTHGSYVIDLYSVSQLIAYRYPAIITFSRECACLDNAARRMLVISDYNCVVTPSNITLYNLRMLHQQFCKHVKLKRQWRKFTKSSNVRQNK